MGEQRKNNCIDHSRFFPSAVCAYACVCAIAKFSCKIFFQLPLFLRSNFEYYFDESLIQRTSKFVMSKKTFYCKQHKNMMAWSGSETFPNNTNVHMPTESWLPQVRPSVDDFKSTLYRHPQTLWDVAVVHAHETAQMV